MIDLFDRKTHLVVMFCRDMSEPTEEKVDPKEDDGDDNAPVVVSLRSILSQSWLWVLSTTTMDHLIDAIDLNEITLQLDI